MVTWTGLARVLYKTHVFSTSRLHGKRASPVCWDLGCRNRASPVNRDEKTGWKFHDACVFVLLQTKMADKKVTSEDCFERFRVVPNVIFSSSRDGSLRSITRNSYH